MKIIDYERKGNVIRFYLGNDDCMDYYGDDWNDVPYDLNAGKVYNDFIISHYDMLVPFDYTVLEPCDCWSECRWSKDDMKKRRVPCVIIVPDSFCDECDRLDDFNGYVCADRVIKYYFGDKVNIKEEIKND